MVLVESSVHNLSTHADLDVAVVVFQHRLPFPIKFLQVSLVPKYYEQGSVEAMHPFPFVRQPFKNLVQSASVVAS